MLKISTLNTGLAGVDEVHCDHLGSDLKSGDFFFYEVVRDENSACTIFKITVWSSFLPAAVIKTLIKSNVEMERVISSYT